MAMRGYPPLNRKVEKPIFMRLRGPKALDDKRHEGTQRGKTYHG